MRRSRKLSKYLYGKIWEKNAEDLQFLVETFYKCFRDVLKSDALQISIQTSPTSKRFSILQFKLS